MVLSNANLTAFMRIRINVCTMLCVIILRNNSRYRRNISIGIPLDLSIPTEMTSIKPLFENKKSLKTPKKLKIMLCYIFFDG